MTCHPERVLSLCNAFRPRLLCGSKLFPVSCQQVLWSDEVTSGEEIPPSTRMLINMFLLDGDRNVSDAVVTARLPYSRVKIEGSAPFSFISNDVVRTPLAYP